MWILTNGSEEVNNKARLEKIEKKEAVEVINFANLIEMCG